ncbi:amino acid ABC transporter permease [Aminobacter sp. Piv2-1]|uniref:amino acid ABC transporter permease n=1 Tax=Aminobacter sp. Piv2-1 TaxID=3031122 RepID=UPI0030A19D1F
MSLDFSWLSPYQDAIFSGILVTIRLTLIGGSLGFVLGVATAWARVHGGPTLRWAAIAYVEGIRNTPFLVQLLFIFFGLPALGLRLTAEMSGIIALVVNTGAYMGEILRGGIEATHKGQYEAASSLAMSGYQTFRHVILFPSIQRVWPALVGQFILDMFQTSVISQIAVEELTFVASFIQSRNFRAFETYIFMAGTYLVLAFLMRRLLLIAGRFVFRMGVAR